MVRLSKKALNTALLTQGINVNMLARRSNIHGNTISQYLHCDSNIRYSTAFKLATALNVSPFDLIEESGADDDDDRRIYRAGKAATGKRKVK